MENPSTCCSPKDEADEVRESEAVRETDTVREKPLEVGEDPLSRTEDVDVSIPDAFLSSYDEEALNSKCGEFRGYSRRDKYGFELVEDYMEEELRYAHIHATREQERQSTWRSYFDKIKRDKKAEKDAYSGTSFRSLARGGIPAEYRREVWKKVLKRSDGKRKNKGESTNYLEILLDNASRSSESIDQIRNDVHRTFPGHAIFDSEDGLQKLTNILTAYSWSNPDIGYCQSMNFLCGQFLLLMSEEEAFQCLSVLIEERLPPNYFTHSMLGSHVDQKVFEILVEEKLPVIHKVVSTYSLSIASVTAQWFLCMFVGVTPAETTFRMWDVILTHGVHTIFQFALALLKLNERELIACEDEGFAFILLREIPKRMFDCDKLVKTAFSSSLKLSDNKIQKMRKQCEPMVRAQQEEITQRRERAAVMRRKRKAKEEKERTEQEEINERERKPTPELETLIDCPAPRISFPSSDESHSRAWRRMKSREQTEAVFTGVATRSNNSCMIGKRTSSE